MSWGIQPPLVFLYLLWTWDPSPSYPHGPRWLPDSPITSALLTRSGRKRRVVVVGTHPSKKVLPFKELPRICTQHFPCISWPEPIHMAMPGWKAMDITSVNKLRTQWLWKKAKKDAKMDISQTLSPSQPPEDKPGAQRGVGLYTVSQHSAAKLGFFSWSLVIFPWSCPHPPRYVQPLGTATPHSQPCWVRAGVPIFGPHSPCNICELLLLAWHRHNKWISEKEGTGRWHTVNSKTGCAFLTAGPNARPWHPCVPKAPLATGVS